jgi:hypothetical protein
MLEARQPTITPPYAMPATLGCALEFKAMVSLAEGELLGAQAVFGSPSRGSRPFCGHVATFYDLFFLVLDQLVASHSIPSRSAMIVVSGAGVAESMRAR